jgi:uncharacterized coiled-coil protein SlyX
VNLGDALYLGEAGAVVVTGFVLTGVALRRAWQQNFSLPPPPIELQRLLTLEERMAWGRDQLNNLSSAVARLEGELTDNRRHLERLEHRIDGLYHALRHRD